MCGTFQTKGELESNSVWEFVVTGGGGIALCGLFQYILCLFQSVGQSKCELGCTLPFLVVFCVGLF